MTAIVINGVAQIIRLRIPLTDFPGLLAIHGGIYSTTDACERLGKAYVDDDFSAERTSPFVKAVCKWGNYEGVGGKVLKHNTIADIRNYFCTAHAALLRGDAAEAIRTVTRIKGLAVSFGSKHLKFMAPDRAVVLDSIISERLGYIRTPEGYAEFVQDCATIRDLLNAANIAASQQRFSWRISDVEMAIFKKVNPSA